jgi:hypothetical protein
VLTDKGIHRCTAFIVSKLYILANYHCSLGVLENARIDATRIDAITFVAGYTQTGIEEGTRKYTVIPTPIEASKELDYAVLVDSLRQKSLFAGFPSDQLYATVLDA